MSMSTTEAFLREVQDRGAETPQSLGQTGGRVFRALQERTRHERQGADIEDEATEEEMFLHAECLYSARRERDELFNQQAELLQEMLGGSSVTS